jgi:hypothetical protein
MVVKAIDAFVADYTVLHAFINIYITNLAFELLALFISLKLWVWLCDKET